MKTGPQPKVSSFKLMKPETEPTTLGLQGEWFIHYTTAVPVSKAQEIKIKCSVFPLSSPNPWAH